MVKKAKPAKRLQRKATPPAIRATVAEPAKGYQAGPATVETLQAALEAPPPAPEQPVTVEPMRVYLDAQRHTAIVTKVGRTVVTFLSLGLDAGIELKRWDVRDFVREFMLCLPHYPVRRAARIYTNSLLSKSDAAQHELRRLLTAWHTVQTFLVCSDFADSAVYLDRQRLGKQRVEAKQILLALQHPKSYGWQKHPAVKMWRGYAYALAQYGVAVCKEWRARGYKDSLLPFFEDAITVLPASAPPPWVSDPAFHRAHQSNLVRKLPGYYVQAFPGVPPDLPYVWPV